MTHDSITRIEELTKTNNALVEACNMILRSGIIPRERKDLELCLINALAQAEGE